MRTLRATKADRIIVGFAAETDHVAEHARAKLESKQADLIVANDVTAEGAGFDHDTNVITLYLRDGSEKAFPRMPKIDAAHRILDQLRELRRCRLPRQSACRRSAAPLTCPMDSRRTETPREKLEAWLRYFDDLNLGEFYTDRRSHGETFDQAAGATCGSAVRLPVVAGSAAHLLPRRRSQFFPS